MSLNRHLVRLEVPDKVRAAREVIDVSRLPTSWAATLGLPSVIVAEESAALVDPLHPDAKTMSAEIVRLFEYRRLFGCRSACGRRR